MRKSHDLLVAESYEEYIEVLAKQSYAIVSKRFGRRVREYVDTVITLDIETTNTEHDGFAYSFQMCVGGQCVVVRYVEDCIAILNWVADHYGTTLDRRMVVYVHNLGYEHFYLTQLFTDEWGAPDNSLLTQPHKPLTIFYRIGIEFRDSLKLFQKSLAGATKGCAHEKLVGDLDYNEYRTPDTPLTQEEFDYCVNDVIGLYEAIMRLRAERGYNQATIPYTNTGIVIAEVNKNLGDRLHRGKTMRAMAALQLNKRQMELAYNSMGGGDTHGCRWRAGITYEKCNSYDLKSAHPSQMILRPFPKGAPMDVEDLTQEQAELLIDNGYGWCGKALIGKFHIKPECPDPTLSLSKCTKDPAPIGLDGLDNGRVMGADAVLCYMDSNDWQRFRQAYDYEDMYLVEGVAFALDYLPDDFRKAILDKFRDKENKEKDSPDYRFAKIVVNTIFGACAQKTVRDECELSIDEYIEVTKTKWETKLKGMDDDAVYKSQKGKFPFLWGLWTASLSRLMLFELIKAVGWEKAIYWDTDSCKYEGDKVPEVDRYNENVRAQCILRDAVVIDRDGHEVYIGTAEDEHPTEQYGYRKFRFLHAKCYAGEGWNVKKQAYIMETTIAGVGKKQGVQALDGDIDRLSNGLYIADAGGNQLTYNDRPIITRTCFKRPTRTASYIYMQPRQYLVQDTNTARMVDKMETEIISD